MVCQQLQRNGTDQWLQVLFNVRHIDHVISDACDVGVAFAGNRDDRTFASLDLFHVADDFRVDAATRNHEDAGSLFIHQSDRAMFHFGGRIAFRMNVADFLQLQRTFQRDREVVEPTKVQKVVEAKVLVGHFTDSVMALQSLADFVGHIAQLAE